MDRILKDTEPKEVFYYFEDLTRIPRESGNERQVAEYLENFAKSHGLDCIVDQSLNVLIKKPASVGYENHPTVILQGHIDMVCEKNAGVNHDFTKDPIKFQIEDDKVIAKETTLGADDGMGVSFALALLADKDAKHPAIELVCTSDEERGMSGVEALGTSTLKGRVLINLDADDEGVFVVGCAGGPVVKVEIPIEKVEADKNKKVFSIKIKGLKGGHSGEDIHRGRANSIKLLSRILNELDEKVDFDVFNISGGLKYNAIPREAEVKISLPENQAYTLKTIVDKYSQIFLSEFRVTDPDINLVIEKSESEEYVLSKDSVGKIIDYLYLSECGIVRMNAELPDTVESSISLGVIRLEDKQAIIEVMTRSSVESVYKEMYNKIKRLSKNVGALTYIMSNCPEWEYDSNSKVKEIFRNVYKKIFEKEPRFIILHAGLECGVFGKKIEGKIDMIAAGPDIRDLHTPGEYVTISSTQKFWRFFKEVLSNL